MKLDSLLIGINTRQISHTDVEISNIQFDSRKVTTGSLFVAEKGVSVDGHTFIPKAIEQGAVAIVCEHAPEQMPDNAALVIVENSAEALGRIAANFYNNPSRQLQLVGVTGTNGKTTIATLLYKLVRTLGIKAGLLSTVCNYVDTKQVAATHTTPDAIALNALLRDMVDCGCEYAFMEVSSHAADQHRIDGLYFTGGIFTNLTRDHLDYHLTVDNYLKAKKRFFDILPSEAFALTNADDRNGMVMLQNTKANKHTYAIATMADFRANILDSTFEGMQLNISGNEVFVPLVGRFNASNLMAIYGAALLLGFKKEEVLVALSTLQPVVGRFSTLQAPQGYTAIVDYAHTPDAVVNVINTINDIRSIDSRLITVVGCGGNRDKGKRPIMAKEAMKGSDQLILTSDNPRDEEPEDILNDMMAGLTAAEQQRALCIVSRRDAIKTACSMAKPGDVILVAGKGHEDYQIVKGVKHHFDDREELQKAMGLQ
ncbi:MAG: UDP-N-acetylmuramoyl-L-alanyl-D-glutamate--2,6-diaminopimelate ligase [Bacteroidales bacterium]|nr:UDP-N-acetylmuramoyl-L-alanyl-D-glutamate--2,6-diaminopimelate ligase [Bacteroidales bacterium]